MLGGVKGPREKETERQRQRETETEADRERERWPRRDRRDGDQERIMAVVALSLWVLTSLTWADLQVSANRHSVYWNSSNIQ